MKNLIDLREGKQRGRKPRESRRKREKRERERKKRFKILDQSRAKHLIGLQGFQDLAWSFMDIWTFRHGIDQINHDSLKPPSPSSESAKLQGSREKYFFVVPIQCGFLFSELNV